MREQDREILTNHEKMARDYMRIKGYTPISLGDISILNETYLQTNSPIIFEELIIKLQLIIVKVLEFVPLNFERQSLNDMSDCIDYFNEYFIECIAEGKFINIEGISEILTRKFIDGLRMLTYSENDERTQDHQFDVMYDPYESLLDEMEEEQEELEDLMFVK